MYKQLNCTQSTNPPSIFQIAKRYNNNLTTAASFSWSWFDQFFDSKYFDYYFDAKSNDKAALDAMIEFIVGSDKLKGEKHKIPNLMFLHLDDVDHAGHEFNWGSYEYYQAIKAQDKRLETIINVLKMKNIYDKTMIILMSDHGGIGNSHTEFVKESLFIPIIIVAPGIEKGKIYNEFIGINDIAPLVLNVLGVTLPKYVRGKLLENIFVGGSQRNVHYSEQKRLWYSFYLLLIFTMTLT
eukprot:UN03805